jgi:hypothetical protein
MPLRAFREGEIIYLNGESDASEKVCLVLLSKVPLDMEIPKESVLCAVSKYLTKFSVTC